MKITRQGVRDLNGYRMDGRQLNQRTRPYTPPPAAAFCAHGILAHDADCYNCSGEWIGECVEPPPHTHRCVFCRTRFVGGVPL